MTNLFKTPIIGRLTATVDSSSNDMLAGLSKLGTLRMPPCFWANAVPAENPSNRAPAVVSTQRHRLISYASCSSNAGYRNQHLPRRTLAVPSEVTPNG